MSKPVLANLFEQRQSINWALDQPGDGTRKQMGARFNASQDNVIILFQFFYFLCFVSGLNILPMFSPRSASPQWQMIKE